MENNTSESEISGLQVDLQNLEEQMSPAYKKHNIQMKKIFNKWIVKAINEDNEVLFSECVENIGAKWHVKRTVKDNFDNFVKNLWKNKENISAPISEPKKEYKYKWWESEYHAYSYESKICFLINPQKYKVIYDTNTQKALENKIKKIISKENFQKLVEEYYKNNNLQGKTDEIFKIDCDLWQEGKKLNKK